MPQELVLWVMWDVRQEGVCCWVMGLLLGYGLLAMRGSGRGFSGWMYAVAVWLMCWCQVVGCRHSELWWCRCLGRVSCGAAAATAAVAIGARAPGVRFTGAVAVPSRGHMTG